MAGTAIRAALLALAPSLLAAPAVCIFIGYTQRFFSALSDTMRLGKLSRRRRQAAASDANSSI